MTEGDRRPFDLREVPPEILARAYVNLAHQSEDKLKSLAYLELAGTTLTEAGLKIEDSKLEMQDVLRIANRAYVGNVNGLETGGMNVIVMRVIDKFPTQLTDIA